MYNMVFKIYGYFLMVVNVPYVLKDYFAPETGREYGVGFIKKLVVTVRMAANNLTIISGSNFFEHLAMATKILRVPKSTEGCLVECGSYKGVSTSNLSLVARLCNRRLNVFDSFQGLPEPSERDKAHIIAQMGKVDTYAKGAWAGSLEEVKGNVTRHGAIEVCDFNVGFFEDSMPHFEKDCAFAFIDVDLRDSLETCVRYLWPLLMDGCCIFTHEAHHKEIAALFFDTEWWRENLSAEPPGLIGASTELGMVPGGHFLRGIGYAVKNPQVLDLREDPQVGASRDKAGRRAAC